MGNLRQVVPESQCPGGDHGGRVPGSFRDLLSLNNKICRKINSILVHIHVSVFSVF